MGKDKGPKNSIIIVDSKDVVVQTKVDNVQEFDIKSRVDGITNDVLERVSVFAQINNPAEFEAGIRDTLEILLEENPNKSDKYTANVLVLSNLKMVESQVDPGSHEA